jgi:integrase/recombinase XerC
MSFARPMSGDIRTTDDGAAIIHVKGKGGKERSVPIETEMLSVIEAYLASRAARFLEPRSPSRVGLVTGYRDGPPDPRCSSVVTVNASHAVSRQSRIKRVFKRAGPDAQPVPVAV